MPILDDQPLLAERIKEIDEKLYEHSRAVVRYAKALFAKYYSEEPPDKIPDEIREAVAIAALAHDAGFWALLNLYKGKRMYSAESIERKVIETHSELSAKFILDHARSAQWTDKFIALVTALILYHHRGYDFRTGYPLDVSDGKIQEYAQKYDSLFDPQGDIQKLVGLLRVAEDLVCACAPIYKEECDLAKVIQDMQVNRTGEYDPDILKLLDSNDPIIGTWTLDPSKSQYSPGPPPQMERLTVNPAGPTFTFISEFQTAKRGAAKVSYSAYYDGHRYPVEGTGAFDEVILYPRIHFNESKGVRRKDGTVIQTWKRKLQNSCSEMVLEVYGHKNGNRSFNNRAFYNKSNP